MTLKEKLKCLSYIRKSIREQLNTDTTFICQEYDNWIKHLIPKRGTLTHKYPSMDDAFPELKTEIIRTGREHRPSYNWASALEYSEKDGNLESIFGRDGTTKYNKHKLVLVSRVRRQLTKGKY